MAPNRGPLSGLDGYIMTMSEATYAAGDQVVTLPGGHFLMQGADAEIVELSNEFEGSQRIYYVKGWSEEFNRTIGQYLTGDELIPAP
jgi:hypothetical protein